MEELLQKQLLNYEVDLFHMLADIELGKRLRPHRATLLTNIENLMLLLTLGGVSAQTSKLILRV